MTYSGTRQVELIGFVAAFCTTMAFVPQLLHYDRRAFDEEAGV